MAGIITIAPGHDASYPWLQIGTSAQPAEGTPSEQPAQGMPQPGVAYYLSPAEKGGEPPGRWRGAGLAELGFHEGQVIDREVFERLYGQFLDPRDPGGETRLGRSPQRFRSAEEIYAGLIALEPGTTAERRAELMIEAKNQVRLPVQYFDVTFSVSKLITLLHASALANAAQAEATGDETAAAYWRQAAADVWASIEAGNQAALDYLQREAGYTRSGYHGRQVNGVTSGRWEDAHRLVIGSFPQHTSRDGDPQLHIHNLVLNRVQRERDAAWRTLDSKGLFEHRGAASAIATMVMESALSRQFGVGWVQRADGHGREITGVRRELMEQFSSRRQSISALTERLAREFEEQHGYPPDSRALGQLRRWANHATRARKGAEPLDLGAEVRRWAEHARASEAGALEPVMPEVTSRSGPRGSARPEPVPIFELTPGQRTEVMTLALATLQGSQPTWRKADLIRHLGELLPDNVVCRDDRAAAVLLEQMADRALAGAAGQQALTLTAPEWPTVPLSLRRADGRSVYRPHGGIRYATLAQLSMEDQLIAQAQECGAPCLSADQAALLLGAEQAQLEAQLGAADTHAAQRRTGSGLRLDQAAAAFAVLTSDRRAEILVGPAGSGKTHTAAVAARLWQRAGKGEVHGLAVSQAARNVLHEAGVDTADNLAQFLGHLKGRREARGAKPIAPGTLLVLDEASTIPIADLAAVMRLAAEHGCRVLITGDHEQLAAVEGGGGMTMLARQLGFTQLAEPVRFASDWERDATLRLRAGEASVLAGYDERGRLRGGNSEQAADLACRAFVADYLAGRDVLLLARTSEQARELSRRVRDDLVRFGLVDPRVQVGLRHHATAGRGDLIMARRNDRKISAGAPGRWLANRDVLRIEDAGQRTVTLRRMSGRDPGTGQPTWSEPFELSRAYVFSDCDLAYATTVHAAQGRTVAVGYAFVDGLGSRQWLYVAMSRGARANYVYCVTGYPGYADAQPGSRPAPELTRARRLAQEHAGHIAAPGPGSDRGRAANADDADYLELQRDPVAVLAGMLRRDGAVLSAAETLRAELSNADHLGVLGPIWYDLNRRAQVPRFTAELREALPGQRADEALSDPACTWLWRSLRHAEVVGLDGTDVLRQAINARSLIDARHVVRVLDSRVRHMIKHLPPADRTGWADRIPAVDDADVARFMTELGHAMDERTRRIGEHAAAAQPAWALHALGPVPAEPAERAEWQERAARIGAYRELYGYDAHADPIGPAPGLNSPEAWADWHTAFGALDRLDGIDLRGATDGQLSLRRAAYQRELAWAPPYAADDVRLARLQARTAWENAIRARHSSRAATNPQAVARHRDLARTWQAMHIRANGIAGTLATADETRRQWAALTEPTRRAALAADLELRRRHPEAKLPPLTPAEPAATVTDGGSQAWVEQAIVGDSPSTAVGGNFTTFKLEGERNPTGHSAGPDRLADLASADIAPDALDRLARIADNARRAQQQIDYLRSMPRYAADDHSVYLGTAWEMLARRERDAIIQPPKPEIVPADAVLQRAQERVAEAEPELEAG